jgi:peptidoglycan/xylan/chitin deacetylase (PgdA/CDA1 family)
MGNSSSKPTSVENDAHTQVGFFRAAGLGVRARADALKRMLKSLLGPLLWLPVMRALRASNRRAGLVLLYHEIGDRDGDPRRELVPPISRARLARHLAHLRRYYRLVELTSLPAAVAARRRGEPFPVALTFDDDLGHHVTHALPELDEADAPATFFLCGSFLDEPHDFWWQRLQRSVDGGADVAALLGTGTIHAHGVAIQLLTPERRDDVADELLRLAGPAPASELLTAQGARRLPHIGFHTVRHDPLTHIDDEQLARALGDGRARLAELAGYPIDTIAYPHGNCDSRVLAAARESKFTIGLTCEQEAVTPRSDPLALGRYEPPARGSMGEFAFDLVRTLTISPS